MNCYVLTGGRSRRMGMPKHELTLGGTTFLERVIKAASSAFSTVEVIASRGAGEAPGGETAAMFGLVHAVDREEGKFWLLATDYPLLTTQLLTFLRERFMSSGAEIFVPEWHSRPQMLCAGYDASIKGVIARRIESGNLRMQSLLSEVRSEVVPERDLREHFSNEPLWNINDRADLEELRKHHGEAE